MNPGEHQGASGGSGGGAPLRTLPAADAGHALRRRAVRGGAAKAEGEPAVAASHKVEPFFQHDAWKVRVWLCADCARELGL